MKIIEHFDKNNLHHAYLIEGKKEEIILDIFIFMKDIGVEIKANPDFNQINLDSFKINDARILKSQSIEKGISAHKKVFIISINNFLIEAQNSLLKTFEEPIENTIFFLIVPDVSIILPTLLSRFYIIKSKDNLKDEILQAQKFIGMSLNERIFFIKEFIGQLKNEEDQDFDSSLQNINMIGDSVRSRTIKFLNALEKILHQKLIERTLSIDKGLFLKTDYFYQIFKAREFLFQPSSSIKSIFESVAIVIPIYLK